MEFKSTALACCSHWLRPGTKIYICVEASPPTSWLARRTKISTALANYKNLAVHGRCARPERNNLARVLNTNDSSICICCLTVSCLSRIKVVSQIYRPCTYQYRSFWCCCSCTCPWRRAAAHLSQEITTRQLEDRRCLWKVIHRA